MSTLASGNEWTTKKSHLDVTTHDFFEKRIRVMDEKFSSNSKAARECGSEDRQGQ